MTREDLLKYYSPFDDDELFYRNYYYNATGNEAIIYEIADRLKKDPFQPLNVWIPEMIDLKDGTCLSELMLGSQNNNVSVRKHCRYNPLFCHTHTFFEIVYVLSGCCENMVAGYPIRMKRGDMCIIAPGMYHSLGVFDDTSIVLNILVRKSTFQETFFDVFQQEAELSDFFYQNYYFGRLDNVICFHTEGETELETLLYTLFSESIRQQDYCPHIMENLMRVIFCLMFRQKPDKIYFKIDSDEIQKQENMIRYIQVHYSNISMNDLVEEFHLSESSIRRILRKSLQISLVDFVREIRLQKACMLLKNTELQVNDIALNVGYQSDEYFYRLFRNAYGMSPLEYRKKNRRSL